MFRQSLHRKRSPFRNLNRRSEPVGSLLVSVDSSASLLPALRALSSVTFDKGGKQKPHPTTSNMSGDGVID